MGQKMFDDLSKYIEFNLLFFICFGTAATFLLLALGAFLARISVLGKMGLMIASVTAALGCALQSGATHLAGWDIAMTLCMGISLFLVLWFAASWRLRYLATRQEKRRWSEYD